MEINNATIYHCIVCGHIVTIENEAATPQCCGKAMAKAAAETISVIDVDPKIEDASAAPTYPQPDGRMKPK